MVNYYYDAWGNHTLSGNLTIANENPFRYRGYFYDKETGFYYLQTRYYDPEVGRFISPDDTKYVDPEIVHGLNLYAYCGNNPVMFVDPDGTSFILLVGIILGVLVSGAISGALAADSRNEDESYWGAFLGGFIDGAIGAIAIAAGVATGGIGGLFIAAAGSFIGGFVGNMVSQIISYGDFDYKVSLVQGGISALINSTMYLGLSLTNIISGSKWIIRFIDALKISEIGVGISVFFAQFSLPNVNRSRWQL